jgi:hypothetical protein
MEGLDGGGLGWGRAAAADDRRCPKCGVSFLLFFNASLQFYSCMYDAGSSDASNLYVSLTIGSLGGSPSEYVHIFSLLSIST